MTEYDATEIYQKIGEIKGTLQALPDTIAASVAKPINEASDRMCKKLADAMIACQTTRDKRMDGLDVADEKLEKKAEDIKREHAKTRWVVIGIGVVTMLVASGADIGDVVGRLIKLIVA